MSRGDPAHTAPGPGPILGLVVPDLFHASVTFFHEHIARIAPGRTVVVHLSSTGEPAQASVPVLEIAMPRPWPEPGVRGFDRLVRQANFYRAARLSRSAKSRVVRFLQGHGVTHLFAEFAHVAAIIAPIARGLRLPLTSMSHGYDINVLGEMPLWRLRYRGLFRSDVRLIGVVPFLRQRMVRLGGPADRIAVIPCAVDAAAFQPADHSSGPARVAMLARLTAQKGPLQSLQAFALALDRRPELTLDVVGDGPLMPEVREEVARLGIGERVRLHGATPHANALAILARSHIFLQHCRTLPRQGIESQGVSVLEAMGHGLVPIVTRHGGLTGHIVDGERGWLVEEGDIAGMARRIVQMADDAGERRRIGAAARKWVLETFSPEAVYPPLREQIGLSPAPSET